MFRHHAVRGVEAFAIDWMSGALQFLLLQVIALVIASAVMLATMMIVGSRLPGRVASAVAWTTFVLADAVFATLVLRSHVRSSWRAAGPPLAHAPDDDHGGDGAFVRLEWAVLGAAAAATIVSLAINGTRPGWAIAVGLVDAIGAYLLLAGAVAASVYDREWHARAWLACLILAASSAWTLTHG